MVLRMWFLESRVVDHTESVDNEVQQALTTLTDAEREIFEERAGIMEFDGGLSRGDAERAAIKAVLGRR